VHAVQGEGGLGSSSRASFRSEPRVRFTVVCLRRTVDGGSAVTPRERAIEWLNAVSFHGFTTPTVAVIRGWQSSV
jgi:hypothetical protein